MPDRLAGLDRRVHLGDLVLADQVADGRRADHDLVRRDAALAVLGLQQRLRDHGHQRFGQHRAHHVLFRRREHVDDPVDGLGGRARVQRAEHEVARFRGGERQADRLEIAHFADEDVVRVFAQRRAQRVGERQRVRPDLALVDQALLRLVQELDRILDGEDVPVLALVDVVDHRGERGRLARARSGPVTQDQAARAVGHLGEDLRRVELLERQHLRRNGPERRRRAALLVEGVDAEAREVGDARS